MRAAGVALLLLWTTAGGAQDARYLIRGDQLPADVTANGYSQTAVPSGPGAVEVAVTAAASPISSRGTYAEIAVTEGEGIPPGFVLPQRLRDDLTPDLSAWEAATRVLEWSARHVVVDSDDGQPQDAISVLARGRGRCSGIANATAALLMAAGFEATTISGLLVGDGGEAIPHRWVACRLPGAGWIHTDPTLGLWTITARHITFAEPVVRPVELRVLASVPDTIDRLPRRAGRPVRPDRGTDLICRVVRDDGAARATAVITGAGGQSYRLLLEPQGRFTSLLPGRWRLVVTAEDHVVEDRELLLRAGAVHSYTVTLPAARRHGEAGS